MFDVADNTNSFYLFEVKELALSSKAPFQGPRQSAARAVFIENDGQLCSTRLMRASVNEKTVVSLPTVANSVLTGAEHYSRQHCALDIGAMPRQGFDSAPAIDAHNVISPRDACLGPQIRSHPDKGRQKRVADVDTHTRSVETSCRHDLHVGRQHHDLDVASQEVKLPARRPPPTSKHAAELTPSGVTWTQANSESRCTGRLMSPAWAEQKMHPNGKGKSYGA